MTGHPLFRMRDLFPEWFSHTSHPSIPWHANINIYDSATLVHIENFIREDQHHAISKGAIPQLENVTRSITSDLIRLQSITQKHLVSSLHYLQFNACVWPATSLVHTGRLYDAHDWLVFSLSDSFPQGIAQDVYPTRLDAFLELDFAYANLSLPYAVLEYGKLLYYYARLRSALIELAECITPAVLSISHTFANYKELLQCRVDALLFGLSWASEQRTDFASVFVDQLNSISTIRDVPLNIKDQIHIAYATHSKQHTNQDADAWAEWLYDNAWDRIQNIDKLRILQTLIQSHQQLRKLQNEVFECVAAFSSEIRQQEETEISFLEALESRHRLIMPFVRKAFDFPDREFLKNLLCKWYCIDKNIVLENDVLFVLTSFPEGVGYLSNTPFVVLAKVSLQENVAVMNDALGLNQTVQTERQIDCVPERPGFPNYSEGDRFEKNVNEMYGFEIIPEKNLRENEAMVVLPPLLQPLQSLMLEKTGRTLPILTSFEKPETDRRITNVALWYSGGDMLSEFEAESVEGFLRTNGVHVDCISGSSAGAKQFKEIYKNPIYDAIWVSGHGAFSHWSVNQMDIELAPGVWISAETLCSLQVPGEGRRLLFLNICDGAAFAPIGALPKAGIGTLLAGGRQAVISHQWPVYPVLAGSLGCALATELIARDMSFFDAFQQTLRAVSNGWNSVEEQLGRYPCFDQIRERLQNIDVDSENILHRGSLTFLQ